MSEPYQTPRCAELLHGSSIFSIDGVRSQYQGSSREFCGISMAAVFVAMTVPEYM